MLKPNMGNLGLKILVQLTRPHVPFEGIYIFRADYCVTDPVRFGMESNRDPDRWEEKRIEGLLRSKETLKRKKQEAREKLGNFFTGHLWSVVKEDFRRACLKCGWGLKGKKLSTEEITKNPFSCEQIRESVVDKVHEE